MKNTQMLKLILGLTSTTTLVFFVLFLYFYCQKRSTNDRDRQSHDPQEDIENQLEDEEAKVEEDLVTFNGGEDLTICDILDAPGEVIGKSNYGTLYKAHLQSCNSVRLLRFLRPVCATKGEDFDEAVRFIGRLRHPNLVPLLGFYAGSRGEKLLVHPFYRRGNLSHFITDIYLFLFLKKKSSLGVFGSFVSAEQIKWLFGLFNLVNLNNPYITVLEMKSVLF